MLKEHPSGGITQRCMSNALAALYVTSTAHLGILIIGALVGQLNLFSSTCCLLK